jgi:hypothetical protein
MSREAAGRAIIVLGVGGYRTPPITSDLIDFWTGELAPLNDDDLDKASHDWAREMDHYPTLAEFLDAVRFQRRKRLAKEERQLQSQDKNDQGPELSREENLRHLKEVRDLIAQQTGPLFRRDGAPIVPISESK